MKSCELWKEKLVRFKELLLNIQFDVNLDTKTLDLFKKKFDLLDIKTNFNKMIDFVTLLKNNKFT